MIKLIKMDEETTPNLQIGDYEHYYKLLRDNQGIGYGTINKDKENELFIFIDKNERGNGYGKVLFSKMLEETKNLGYKELKIQFDKENAPMKKIATENGGVETSKEGDNFKYIIPLK